MPVDLAQLESIFSQALRQPTGADLRAFLDGACGGDVELRQRVERLLAAHANAGDFMRVEPDSATRGETPGSQIGRFKLLEQVGEGGFGVVFMAEQQHPIRRLVALKIIKLGMDTRQVIARFEAERQALAMMEHENIARVIDAGATDTGRPYFVMELVKGTPVTQYCDQNRLDIAKRLDLFIQVCHGVQHAHQKGLIHRDLKPSNILIAKADDRAVAKVIDFGIAKAVQARLTEKTLFTEFHQLVGTPEYMSPEQADGGLDMDTRSDVYALGVLLYELLAGAPPFDPKELRSKAYAEMQRIIREVDPPTPSTRLNTPNAALPSVAACRGTEPRKLTAMLRGELDWIVMRCLEKDRNRRYETANALCRDVERYLADETVHARPPTQAYRLRKFARRNRAMLTAVAAVALALVVGAAVSVRQAVRATRAEREALANAQRAVASARQAEAVSDFLVEAFRSPDPARQARSITIAEVLDRARRDLDGRFADEPQTKAAMLHAIASAFDNLGLAAEAVPPYEEALKLRSAVLGERHADSLASMAGLASAYPGARRFEDGVRMAETALRLRTETLGATHPDTLRSMLALAYAYQRAGRNADAVPLARRTLELYVATFGEDARETLGCMNRVGAILGNAGGDSAALFQQAAERLRATLGMDHPDTLLAVDDLAIHLWAIDRRGEALGLWQEVLTRRQVVLGPDHPATRKTKAELASAYRDLGITDPEQLKDLKALTTRPATQPSAMALRGEVRVAVGDLAGAAEDFITAIPQLKDTRWEFSPRKSACRVVAATPGLFDTVARALPDETTLWVSRAAWHACHGRWAQASLDYERVIRRRGLDDELFAYGGVLLLLGEEQAYEDLCRETVQRFGDPSKGGDRYSSYLMAKLCLLGPARCVDAQQQRRWAEEGAKVRLPWRLETLARALLYAGEPEQALRVYEDDQLTNWTEASFGLARAHHALGHTEAAQDNLRKARAMVKQLGPTRPGGPASVAPASRWIHVNLYARQTEAALSRPITAPAATRPAIAPARR